jgi:hypothetical protein
MMSRVAARIRASDEAFFPVAMLYMGSNKPAAQPVWEDAGKTEGNIRVLL